LPGQAQVKNKIKRIDRLLGNSALHNDIPLIFNNIIEMLTRQLSLVVIAVDWSGYPSQDYHVLRASLVCDGRSLPLLSKVVPSSKQNNVLIQKEFLDELAKAIDPEKKVVIITDAGLQANWFQHVKILGWSFIGRVRGNVKFRLQNMGEKWLHLSDMEGKNRPESLGEGTLTRTPGYRCDGYFYLYRKEAKGRKNKRSKGRAAWPKAEKEQRASTKEPWLIFSSSDDFKPREIMKLYSRRMQIEQNFRDEKSERFGFGLRASYSCSVGRMLVLSLLATLSTIVLWLIGYHTENKGLHLRYQANSIKSRRVISYLVLA
jgi:hypothetical protein